MTSRWRTTRCLPGWEWSWSTVDSPSVYTQIPSSRAEGWRWQNRLLLVKGGNQSQLIKENIVTVINLIYTVTYSVYWLSLYIALYYGELYELEGGSWVVGTLDELFRQLANEIVLLLALHAKQLIDLSASQWMPACQLITQTKWPVKVCLILSGGIWKSIQSSVMEEL